MEEGNRNQSVYSKLVRAGKRTYFFDIKSTRANDLFLTITESKKRTSESGESFFEKHKIYLYKEDFEKFIDGLHETFNKFDELRESMPSAENNSDEQTSAQANSDSNDIQFEDL